jgi:hypothetical protein
VNDFLEQKRQEITQRLRELKPAVEEHSRLEAAAAALSKVRPASSRASAATTTRRRGPGRPRGSGTRAKATTTTATKTRATATKARKKPGRPPGSGKKRRAGRRKGSGTRAAQALAFVQGQPGITIPELAAKMGIKQNYLYRVLPGLESEGKVTKQGRGWLPKR